MSTQTGYDPLEEGPKCNIREGGIRGKVRVAERAAPFPYQGNPDPLELACELLASHYQTTPRRHGSND